MAIMTAQIHRGSAQLNHGGINPSYFLFLPENARAAWILASQNTHPEDRPLPSRVVRMPTPVRLLQDALAMNVLHVCKDETVLEAARAAFDVPLAGRLNLVHDAKGPLERMYEACTEVESFPKLSIALFEDACLAEQLPILADFKMDVEVCRPSFARACSAWTGKTRVAGDLRSR